MWGATASPTTRGPSNSNFNPRSPCGERPCSRSVDCLMFGISIHAPRVGSDAIPDPTFLTCRISIHAPRVGSDSAPSPPGGGTKYFNPRSPCGERHSAVIFVDICRYFNPRSPCGERLLVQLIRREERYFNPRSPCGERPLGLKSVVITLLFQSTLPVWGATRS